MVTEKEYSEALGFLVTFVIVVAIILLIIVFSFLPYAILIIGGGIIVALVISNISTVMKYNKENK